MHAKISGLHTATKRLATGRVAIYVYIFKGGSLLCKAEGANLNEANQELEFVLGQQQTLNKLAELRAVAATPVTSANTISTLIKQYRTSPEFRNLRPSTKSEYERYLELFDQEFGSWRTKVFEHHSTGQDIVQWRNQYAHRPRTADYMIASVSRLFSWARSQYHTSANPTADIETLYRADRSDIIWSDEEIERVLAASATEELRHAIKLAAATGLRQGDLLTLPWNAIQGTALVRKTSKKGTTVVMPVEPIRAVLEGIPKRSPTILTSSHGRPWTSDGLRSSFDIAKKKAGIEGKHWHDLRGTAATKLFKNGLKPAQISLWMGWSTGRIENMLRIYVSYDAVADDLLKSMNQEQEVQTAHKPGEN